MQKKMRTKMRKSKFISFFGNKYPKITPQTYGQSALSTGKCEKFIQRVWGNINFFQISNTNY